MLYANLSYLIIIYYIDNFWCDFEGDYAKNIFYIKIRNAR
jgi:hypothetical protein